MAVGQGNAGTASGAYRRPEAMEVEEFDRTARALIDDAEDWTEKNWRPARIEGWERYHGKLDLETKDGDDTSVAYEIRDAVQQIMPEVMEQLAGNDEPVEYYTHDPKRHDLCKQATILGISNFWEGGGWGALHDSTVHAAVGRVGFLKVHRKEELCFEDHEFNGLDPQHVEQIARMPSYTLLEVEDEHEHGLGPDGRPMSWVAARNGVIRRYYVDSTLEIIAPDPATMYATQAENLDKALCIGQRTTVRMGNLREMGFELDELDEISGFEDSQVQSERTTRNREAQQTKQDYGTWALRPVDLYEAYCRIDADGDGLLELWKIIAAGTAKKVLRRMRVRDQPYSAVTIRRSPHTIAGMSFCDLLKDLQETRSRLQRGMNEGISLQTNPMMFVSGTMNVTHLQTIKKRKVVNEGTPGAVRWFVPPSNIGEVLPALDYLRNVRSERIGVDPAAQGLQPDQLTGIAAVAIAGAQQASARVVRLMVRTIAETGIRQAFQKLLKLMVGEGPQHVYSQDGKYVQVDPRAFDPSWGVRARVGLGAMAQQERMGAYQQLISLAQLITTGFGPQNPFIDPPKMAALLQAAVGEYRGLGAQRFFSSPDEATAFMQKQAQQPPPPDPKMMDVQRKAAADQANQRLQQQKAQLGHLAGVAKVTSDTQLGQQRNLLTHDERMLELGLQVPLEKYAIDQKTKVAQASRAAQGDIPRKMRSRS
jgi:hypothetical protein